MMKLKAWKAVRVGVVFGLFFESLFATDVLWLAKAVAQGDQSKQTQNVHTLKLSSSFFATPISLHQTRPASITSIKLAATLTSGQGSGTLELNHTALKFDDFGDFEVFGAHKSESIPVQFIGVEPTSDKFLGDKVPADDPQRSLFKLILPEGFFSLSLVPESALQDCRLIVQRDGGVINIIPLGRESLAVGNPKTIDSKDTLPTTDHIDLSSEYLLTEIGLKDFRIQGTLGSEAKFYLNPNHQGFNMWGEEGMSTLMGWQPRSVDLRLQNTLDPSGKGRKQFELVTNGPRQTRYFLIVSPSESRHRLVIRREETVIHLVPMRATAGTLSN